MEKSVDQLCRISFETLKMRKAYQKYVSYHRYEIDRVTRQMMRVKERNGEEARMPDIVKNLRSEAIWNEMFDVCETLSRSVVVDFAK